MSIESELNAIRRQTKEILQILKGREEPTRWVLPRTLMRELNLTRGRVQGIRWRYPSLARKMGNGRYEYNLTDIKKIAL